MNLNIRHISTLLIAAIALLSCDRSGVEPNIHDDAKVMSFATNVKTRVPETGEDDLKNGFNLWGGFGSEAVFIGEEVYYDDVNLKWTYGEAKHWNNASYDFYAVYPTTIPASYNKDSHEFRIENFNILNNPIDMMIGTTEDHDYPDDGETVYVEFEHAFSQVTFQGKKDKTDSEIIITNISFYGVPRVGTYSSEFGEWAFKNEDYTTNSSPFLKNSNIKLSTSPEDVFATCLFFPSLVETAYTLAFTYKIGTDDPVIKTIQLATGNLDRWEPGKKYTYAFTVIDPNTIIFDPPKVTPWTESYGNVIIVE